MCTIKIGMTKDEVRELVGPAEETPDAIKSVRDTAEAEGDRRPIPVIDTWEYADLPEEGNATVVSFKDDRVLMVMFSEKDPHKSMSTSPAT